MKFEQTGFSVRSQLFGDVYNANGAFRGFHVTFPNGWTVSTQFGTTNYCEVYHTKVPAGVKANDWMSTPCPNGEIAIISPNGIFVHFKSGQEVRGHTDPTTWLQILVWVAAQTTSSPQNTPE